MVKRLCVIVPSHWAAKAGGAELQVKMLLERLQTRHAFDVHYVARNVDPTHVPEGYEIHRVGSRKPIGGSFALDTFELLRVLARVRPDVVYQRVACTYTGVAAYFAQRNRVRMVWHVSSDRDLMPLPRILSWRAPIERLTKYLVNYGARAATSVVVQSETQAELLYRAFGRTDAIQISNSHAEVFGARERTVDRLVVCWIGNVKEIKNPEAFLRLAVEFRQRADVQFVMAGAPQMSDGSWRSLKARIDSLPNVTYLGLIPHDVVGELLGRAHILVNTSPLEGFPNTFIEAWMREVPVLSLQVNPDGVFDRDQNGICAAGSVDRLKSALGTLLDDRVLRERIGRRAAEFARNRFSFSNVDRLIEVLEGP